MQFVMNPLSGNEVLAIMQVFLAWAFFRLWLGERDRSCLWFTASYALEVLACYMTADTPDNALNVQSRQWVGCQLLALMMMVVGVLQHLRMLSSRTRYVTLLLMTVPLLTMVVILAMNMPLARLTLIAGASCVFGLMAVLLCLAYAQEKLTGHLGAAIAALAVVAMCWIHYAADVQVAIYRVWVALPMVPLALALMLTMWQRRKRALEQEVKLRSQAEERLNKLNASLEEKVTQRTADLQSMVMGLESFNRSVSHDLRGPLGGMSSLANLAHQSLAQGDMSVAQRTLPVIASQAESLHRMVNALLQLAHVSDAHLKKKTVDLQQLVTHVVNELQAAKPDGAVQTAVTVDALPEVMTDSELLIPVFMNLIGNALKFAKPGVTPQIKVGTIEQSAHEITLFVQDNGIGFDDAHLIDVFQPFKRLHGQEVEGHGVGLSIVSRAVDRLGGRVWATAAHGQGACFYFTLPKLVP